MPVTVASPAPTARRAARAATPIAADASPAELLAVAEAICDYLTERIEFTSRDDAMLASVWVIGASMFESLPSFPRLFIRSFQHGSGKSLLQHLITMLAGGKNYSSITGPALFRAMRKSERKTTIGLGEIDRLLKQAGSDRPLIETIINEGINDYAAPVGRVPERANGDAIDDFDIYFPIVISGLKSDPFAAEITSRLVEIWLRRGSVEHSRASRSALSQSRQEAVRIRTRLTAALPAITAAVHTRLAEQTVTVLDAELGNRDSDVWLPLYAIADSLSPAWARAVIGAATDQIVLEDSEQPENRRNGIINDLWSALREGFLAPKNYWNPRDIVGLQELLDSTELTTYDIGLTDMGKPRRAQGFTNLAVWIDPSARQFELRWDKRHTDTVALALARVTGKPAMDATTLLREIRSAGCLEATQGQLSNRNRVFREDKDRTQVVRVALGNESCIRWETDKTTDLSPDDGPSRSVKPRSFTLPGTSATVFIGGEQ
jgi:Protein of unknown function (DUF3631)